MNLDSGHKVVPLEAEEQKKHKKSFTGYNHDMMRLNPGNWLLPMNFLNFANKIYNFKFRKSDVVVLTYPKCGTTWAQEIVWTMLNNPNLDHPEAKMSLFMVPFIDFDMLFPKYDPNAPATPDLNFFREKCPGQNPDDGMNLQIADALPDPRTIKTHLPFSLMPPSMLETSKVVFVARNPKDVVISFLHHCRIDPFVNFAGDLEEFVQYFVDDDLVYGPYWLYLKEAWERRNHANLHIVFYEELKANPLEGVRKLNGFLDTHLTDAQLEGIVKYTSFSEMKARGDKLNEEMMKDMEVKDTKVKDIKVDAEVSEKAKEEEQGSFFRKGEVGDWKNKLTPELDEKINHWIKEHLADVGFNIKYGI